MENCSKWVKSAENRSKIIKKGKFIKIMNKCLKIHQNQEKKVENILNFSSELF